MPQKLTNDKSIYVEVSAWCHQETGLFTRANVDFDSYRQLASLCHNGPMYLNKNIYTGILLSFCHAFVEVMCPCGSVSCTENPVKTMRPRQNGRHFSDDIFKCIFLNENIWISIKMSLNFVSKGPNKKFPALIRIMARWRPDNKPLREPNMSHFTATHMYHSASMG